MTAATPVQPALRSRSEWKAAGFRVPTTARPARVEKYLVPGYSTVYRDRHLFASEQVIAINPNEAERRSIAANLAVKARIANMKRRMREAELTIARGKTSHEVYRLALMSHGGNDQGDPGEFHSTNRKARNAIGHCLTNYESLWAIANRGDTGEGAYLILRNRIDALVDEAYPQFAEGAPEVGIV
jgi:hypothetical protein